MLSSPRGGGISAENPHLIMPTLERCLEIAVSGRFFLRRFLAPSLPSEFKDALSTVIRMYANSHVKHNTNVATSVAKNRSEFRVAQQCRIRSAITRLFTT